MELIEQIVGWGFLTTVIVVMFKVLFQSIGQNNFRKALIGLAHRNAQIDVDTVIDLYLGAYEKPRSKLSLTDMRRIESSYLWTLAELAREGETSTISPQTLLHMQSLVQGLRSSITLK
jgi:hypothetical protein